MTTLDIVLIVAGVILIAIPITVVLTIWAQHQKALNEYDAHFKPLITLIPASYWDQSNTPEMQDKLSYAFNMAHSKLRGIWPDQLIVSGLDKIRIQVCPTDSWIGLDGQKVAGRTFLDLGVVLVGPKLEALCHELIHMLEYRLEGEVDYDHKGWGDKKFDICNKYLEDLRGAK